MNCEGVVTEVNAEFLYFKLANGIKIHMSILLTENELQKLPRIGSTVVIKNAHRLSTTYSICKCSAVEGQFTLNYDRNFFYNLVTEYKLGFLDLIKTDEIVNTVLGNYNNLLEDVKIKLIQSTLSSIMKGMKHTKHDKHVCLNTHLSSIKFLTANSCKYIEIQADSDTNKFTDFPHWSFGIHTPQNTFLFGYFKIRSLYGFLMLKDDRYDIPCIIYNRTIDNLYSIESTYVLVKKFKVITEMYQENNIPNIEYLLIDFNDIDVIYAENKVDSLYGKVIPSQRTFIHSLDFQVIHKSTVCIGNSLRPECWLHILLKNEGVSKEIFLILPFAYIKIALYLEERQHYTLFYNETLKETQNTELTRVKKINIYELQESSAFFLKQSNNVNTQNWLSIKKCKQQISNNTDMVSFQGILKTKRFANALSSRTKRRTNIYGFGTPGAKVHQLVFSTNENGETLLLDCYLNNWENLLMPLGLIPQMNIIVRNIYPQSKKYLKASVFTTFDIVAYEPQIDFETVNLYENEKLDWGRQFFLGLGNKIPHGVLIWGRVTNINVLSVKMSNQCIECKIVNHNSELCSCCNGNQRDFNFLVKMQVSDEFGQSKVLTRTPEIMKVLLDLQDYQFETWLKGFKELGQYEYNFFEEDKVVQTLPDRTFFENALTKFLQALNKYSMVFLDLKCRKLDCNPQKYGGRPLWFCIEARRN